MQQKTETLFKDAAGHFDTRKGNNRSAATIPAATVEELEAGQFTSEMLQALAARFPVYRYKTCVTIHGNWAGQQRERIGGYKNLIRNGNGSLEVRYSAIDHAKREQIAEELQRIRSGWYYSASSEGAEFYLSANVTRETIAAQRAEFEAIAARIKTAEFWGDIAINLYSTFGYYVLRLECRLMAILETNRRAFMLTLAGMSATEYEARAAECDAERTAEQAADAARHAEYIREVDAKQQARESAVQPLRAQLATLTPCSDYKQGPLIRIASPRDGSPPFFVIYRAAGSAAFGRVQVESANAPTIPTTPEEIAALKWTRDGKARKASDPGDPVLKVCRRFAIPTASSPAPKPQAAPVETIPAPTIKQEQPQPMQTETPTQRTAEEERDAIAAALTSNPAHLDDIAARVSLTPATTAAALVLLELRGRARRHPGGMFSQVEEQQPAGNRAAMIEQAANFADRLLERAEELKAAGDDGNAGRCYLINGRALLRYNRRQASTPEEAQQCRENAERFRPEARGVFYTTAPASYDGFGTYQSGQGVSYAGRDFRRVIIFQKAQEWQRTRYASGLHAVYTAADIAQAIGYAEAIQEQQDAAAPAETPEPTPAPEPAAEIEQQPASDPDAPAVFSFETPAGMVEVTAASERSQYTANPVRPPSKKVRPMLKAMIEAEQKRDGRASRTPFIDAADAAKCIRAELAAQFPGVKFAVNTKKYSGGSSVRVCWTDGPTAREVEAFTGFYVGQGGNDGTDYYPSISQDFGGVTFQFMSDHVFTERGYSVPVLSELAARLCRYYGYPADTVQVYDGGKYIGGTWKAPEWQAASDLNWNREIRNYLSRCSVRPVQSKGTTAPDAEGGQDAPADPAQGTGNGCSVTTQRDWTWINFDTTPGDAIRATLDTIGAKWSDKRRAWYVKRFLTPEEVATLTGSEPSAPDDQPPADAAPVPMQDAPAVEAISPRASVADTLRARADAMTPQIEKKLNPACGEQRPTARRAEMAASMRADGEKMEEQQRALRALATAHDAGTIAPELAGIKSRAAVEVLQRWKEHPGYRGEWTLKQSDTLENAGITAANYGAARAAFMALTSDTISPAEVEEQRRRAEIRKAEADLLNRKFPGYFPTPAPVVQMMLAEAHLTPGAQVLEPSAGKGNIAEAIRAEEPGAALTCYEIQHTLCKLLTLKGIDHNWGDFMDTTPAASFDRVIMNPPFENFQDIAHVRHAFEHLKPGGRIVAIMGESGFFRSERRAAEFRQWLDELGAVSEQLPAGSFSESGTGVAARIVVIDKPEDSDAAGDDDSETPAPEIADDTADDQPEGDAPAVEDVPQAEQVEDAPQAASEQPEERQDAPQQVETVEEQPAPVEEPEGHTDEDGAQYFNARRMTTQETGRAYPRTGPVWKFQTPKASADVVPVDLMGDHGHTFAVQFAAIRDDIATGAQTYEVLCSGEIILKEQEQPTGAQVYEVLKRRTAETVKAPVKTAHGVSYGASQSTNRKGVTKWAARLTVGAHTYNVPNANGKPVTHASPAAALKAAQAAAERHAQICRDAGHTCEIIAPESTPEAAPARRRPPTKIEPTAADRIAAKLQEWAEVTGVSLEIVLAKLDILIAAKGEDVTSIPALLTTGKSEAFSNGCQPVYPRSNRPVLGESGQVAPPARLLDVDGRKAPFWLRSVFAGPGAQSQDNRRAPGSLYPEFRPDSARPFHLPSLRQSDVREPRTPFCRDAQREPSRLHPQGTPPNGSAQRLHDSPRTIAAREAERTLYEAGSHSARRAQRYGAADHRASPSHPAHLLKPENHEGSPIEAVRRERHHDRRHHPP